MTTNMWTGRGFYDDKGKFHKAFPHERAHAQSEDSNVERDGYRTLKQQIQELEDAGALYVELLKKRYPAGYSAGIPQEEPPSE